MTLQEMLFKYEGLDNIYIVRDNNLQDELLHKKQ